MKKHKTQTPKHRIQSALRQLWLRSRERGAAVKRESNTCEKCGKKGSRARGREVKIHIHHIHGVKWDKMVDYIRKELLVNPDDLTVYCDKCHRASHKK